MLNKALEDLVKKIIKKKYWIWEEGKNNKELRNKLDEFIKSTVDLVRETSSTRTQHNESLNASIRIRAPKNKMFAASNEARVQTAIGKNNDPFFESKLIQSICLKSISSNVMKEIKKDELKQHQRNIQK